MPQPLVAKKVLAKKAAPAKKAPPAAKKAAPASKKIAGKMPAAKKGVPAKKAPAKKAPTAYNGVRPITVPPSKTDLVRLLAEGSGVDARDVKKVMASFENVIFGLAHKKGAGEFTLSGIFKMIVQDIPAKPKRFGKDPFTGEERWFPAKPATVKVKLRPLKKLKDSAL